MICQATDIQTYHTNSQMHQQKIIHFDQKNRTKLPTTGIESHAESFECN